MIGEQYLPPQLSEHEEFVEQHRQEIALVAFQIAQETHCTDDVRNWRQAEAVVKQRHYSEGDWQQQSEHENTFGGRKEEHYGKT